MKPKIFLFIFLILVILLCIVGYIQFSKTIDASQKASCLTYNLQGIIDMTDMKQLCTNEWCNYYFDTRIKYFENRTKECIK